MSGDPILTSIIASRLKTIGQRMGVVVERSARSPLLVEGRDFSVGIYDRDGTLIEQTEYIPVLGYATTPGMRHIARRFAGDVASGDVILHNDPYTGGNQLSDWKVTKPVFHGDEHVAWVVIVAHQADIGGNVPGSYNPQATDMWQEGLRITPVKIHAAGERREDVWDLIFGNVRLDVVADDVTAMIGACTVGERELVALLDRYGVARFRTAVAGMLDAAEQSAGRAIAAIDDGVYRAEWVVHDDGIDHDGSWTIRLAVTVEDDRMSFDFAGTDDQAAGYINTPRAVTMSAVMIAFFMIVEEEIPHNDGVLRRIEVLTPEGSLVDPVFPAPTCFGNHVADQLAAVIMLALAEAVPERVTACWNHLLASIVNGWDDRHARPYVDILLNACKGGGGATFGADGFDHIGLIGSGGAIAAQDPEMFEVVNPHLLHRFEYLPDSAGAGRWRGGLGVVTELEFLDDGAQASVFGDGDTPDTTAFGIRGGGPGSVNAIEFRYPDGRVHRPRLKDLVTAIPRGTVYRQLAGGGGGYGDPRERDREALAADVRAGVVSPAAARELYGWEG
ncbi:N-methylhydantoinase B [Patulibacter medicamentivorans]|uniref:N-methylhydantoinase B n=1 Tax=Patulibacter medicamentivorans TaxID=1097667 RepID=H0E0Q9_9ACTN|nr:hydantoinase B/oxoprolinase family protein [Patulibacter medicamentivorans]EHN12793.1 N-methylhydantoinase B [Patulibacter medicamentivorans]